MQPPPLPGSPHCLRMIRGPQRTTGWSQEEDTSSGVGLKGGSCARVRERSWGKPLGERWHLSQTLDSIGIQQVDIGEVRLESKEQETESKGHVWGMVHGLQKVYRLNITLFIARILFCFVNEVKNNNWKSN